jgi:BirA family biotin operon repressor/biotin-[acetyl-CoA-carboxylase] ligase
MPLDAGLLRSRLPGRELVYLETTPSTMTEAARLAAAGRPAGAMVVAEQQTAAQGRQGRSWHSEAETGLYVSIVLRPGLGSGPLATLTLALGLAVQEAIAASTGVRCALKWPNDVLAGGKKCAGILCTAAGSAVIAGVGVNVNHDCFPPELADSATSLKMVSGRPHSREDLLVELASSVDRYCRLLVEQGPDRVMRLYTERARG